MRYNISLTIEYNYDHASDHARSLIHLLPLAIPGIQDVAAGLLNIDPIPPERWDGRDFFGNSATWITFHEPIVGFSVNLRTQATRLQEPMQMDFSSPLDRLERDIAAINSVLPHAPQHFLGSSPRVSPIPAITQFARARVKPGASTLEAVISIGEALHAEMAFDSTATDVLTAPDEAFELRRGVCQDFSHVMIACLRGLGIPASYVSGFLRTNPPPGQKRMEGADAMHAWVRAWCGLETGWVEYDPTNAKLVGDDHIVIAYGRDYSDVSPVRGSLRSAGAHDTKHFVDVVPVISESQS